MMLGNPYKPQFIIMKLDKVGTGEILWINFYPSKSLTQHYTQSCQQHCREWQIALCVSIFQFLRYCAVALSVHLWPDLFSRGFSYCFYFLYFRSRRYPCDCKSFASVLPRSTKSQLFKSVMWFYRQPDNLQTEPF